MYSGKQLEMICKFANGGFMYIILFLNFFGNAGNGNAVIVQLCVAASEKGSEHCYYSKYNGGLISFDF